MRTLAILLLMPLPLFLPYLWLNTSYFWENPDSIFYLNVYGAYRDALLHGQIFPHWINAANIKLGTLTFYSLSPLVYSLTAIISAPFWFMPENGQFMLGIYASQLFGAWAMYCWLKGHYDERIALSGALIYTLVPYKFIVLYQHFNLAQCWAMAFLPLWMQAAEQISTRRGQCIYALAAALCFYSHPLTVISMGPIALAYGLHCAQWQWRSLVKPLLIAHGLAFGLVASYLAAMLTAIPWMQFKHWAGELFDALSNLYHIDDFLGLYAPLLVWLAYRVNRQDVTGRENAYFWGIVLLALFIVATPLSYPLWALIPAMNVFQFPFARLQPGMGLAVAVLASAMLARRERESTIAVKALLLLFAALCILRVQLVYNRPHVLTEPVYEMSRQDSIIPASVYMPHWTQLMPNDLLMHHDEFKAMSRVEVRFGKAQADMTEEHNGAMRLHVKVESPTATIVPTHFYVPAWKAYEGDKQVEVMPYPNGFIKLELDKGEHDIRLALEKTIPEHIGDILTLLALAAIPLLLRRSYGFKKS